MKAIYHLLIVTTLFGYLCITGCNKDSGDENNANKPAMEASIEGSTNLAWNTEGRFLSIVTAASWTVTFTYPEQEADEWCSIPLSTASGTGSKKLWIATTINYEATVRHVTVAVTAGTTTVTVDIAQYGKDEEVPPDPDPNLPVVNPTHFERPRVVDKNWLLEYTAGDFSLEYAPLKKHPKWVAWPLYKSHMGSSGRTNAWQFDSRIPEEYSPTREDFSGYDRGHLCPSADRTHSREMNAQTFMYSNMSPQLSGLNQKIWATLENKIRGWVGNDTLYICTGGTILKESDIMSYTKPSSMAVPKYYFKVILRKKATTGAFDAIGFWFENKDYGSEALSSKHVKTIDEIETLTGLDFFYSLPENEQNRVEAAFTPNAWL
jgi:endonuclease G